jgi:hypothetical protein
MFNRFVAIALLSVILGGIVSLSAPALAADNATITGDGVRIKVLPSVSADYYGNKLLYKGTRVEAREKTDYSDTVDGYSAPWYGIVYNGQIAYVFGRYVEVDEGVTLDLLHPTPTEYFYDQITRFVDDGLQEFGKTDSEIIEKLGPPVSSKEYDGVIHAYFYEGETFHSLTYDGISFEMHGPAGNGTISEMTCTSGSFKFNGLKVGSSVEDVKRVLGTPYLTDYHNTHRSLRIADGALVSRNDVKGYTLVYRANLHYVIFGVLDEKVTEVTMYVQVID